MSSRGIKRAVIEVGRTVVVGYTRSKPQWICKLECGHEELRRIRRRNEYDRQEQIGAVVEDPEPTWVYCRECKRSHNDDG